MSYQVLARKWRPRIFAEMAGQQHVLQALINALDHNRLHHAYLFTGTRGVGKTTIARILSKCLNCEVGVTSQPCGECASCKEISEGRFIDLIEVDAASRTGVDDMRDLLDNVQYAPSRGRYKIYLIDEVHMLSKNSFAALLKTLEEPPPHVKFLFATTDPQKLPITVLSRCLQFNLKNLSAERITEHLRFVLGEEKLPFEEAALWSLARAADGSMRDGLSLLDQLLAFGGGKVAEAEARTMLATVDRKQVAQLARLLAQFDPAALLAFVSSLDEWAPDYGDVLDALATLFVRVALKQTMPAYEGDELHPAELLAELAGQLAPEDVQLFYQTAILGRRDLAWAPDPRTGFEMTVLRMLAFRPNGSSEGSPTAPVASSARAAVVPSRGGASAGVAASSGAVGGAVPSRAVANGSPQGAAPGVDPARWAETLAALEVGGAARQLAANCVFSSRTGNLVRLTLDPSHQLLRTTALIDKLAQALSRHLGETMRIEVELGSAPVDSPARAEQRAVEEGLDAARRSLEDDAAVRGFKEKFGATLNPDSVKPV